MLYKLLLVFCLYIPFQFALNTSPGIVLASGRVFAVILGILWLFEGLKKRKIAISFNVQNLSLNSFLYLSAFSLFFTQSKDWGLRKVLFLLTFLPIYFVFSSYFQNGERTEKILRFLVYGAGIASVAGIIQFCMQFIIGLEESLKLWKIIITPFLGNSFSQAVFEYPSWLVGVSGHNFFRAIAFFPDPHMFSFYLGMILPFSASLYFNSRKKLFLIISALILLADLLTFSRGGYLGLLVGIIFTLLIFRKNIIGILSLKKFIAINALIIMLLIFLFFPNPISQRLSSSFDMSEGSNMGRIETWYQSLEVIRNNFFGVGIGNYALEIKPSADYREPIYSHNIYLDIAAETGVINFLIFIWLIVASIYCFVKSGKNNDFYYAGAVSLMIFSIHAIFETPLYSIHILPLFLIIISLSPMKCVK